MGWHYIQDFCCASLLTCIANMLVFSLCTLVVQCPDSSVKNVKKEPGTLYSNIWSIGCID